MTTKCYLLLYILIQINSGINAQFLQVNYYRKLALDSRIRNSLSTEKLSKIEKSAEKTASYYSLTICPTYAYWQFDSIRWDCLIGLESNERPIDFLQYDTSGIKIMKFHFDPKAQYYLETYEIPHWPMQWDIDFNRSKMILGYKCYSAKYKGKRTISEVWFTPDIPTKFGPEALNGLPGLALEFRTFIARYTAVAISSISPHLCPQIPAINVKLINHKEYNDLWRSYDYSINGQDFDCGGFTK